MIIPTVLTDNKVPTKRASKAILMVGGQLFEYSISIIDRNNMFNSSNSSLW